MHKFICIKLTKQKKNTRKPISYFIIIIIHQYVITILFLYNKTLLFINGDPDKNIKVLPIGRAGLEHNVPNRYIWNHLQEATDEYILIGNQNIFKTIVYDWCITSKSNLDMLQKIRELINKLPDDMFVDIVQNKIKKNEFKYNPSSSNKIHVLPYSQKQVDEIKRDAENLRNAKSPTNCYMKYVNIFEKLHKPFLYKDSSTSDSDKTVSSIRNDILIGCRNM